MWGWAPGLLEVWLTYSYRCLYCGGLTNTVGVFNSSSKRWAWVCPAISGAWKKSPNLMLGAYNTHPRGSGQPSHSHTPRPITHSRSSPLSQGRCWVKSVMHS